MNSEIKKVLKKIEQNGFESYIVGGFVRDTLLCRATNDVDIATNALPRDILSIFGGLKELGGYGTLNMKTSHFNYDITTYRQEKEYVARKPKKVEYTNNLLTDLERRDFTINAICMNAKGKILDPFNGVKDLEEKIIRTIGEAKVRLQEDPLRILRAIRFACVLNFELEDSLQMAIENQKNEILKLSNFRIKQELDKILIHPNFQKGLALLEKFGILEILEIYPANINYVRDLNGMWAQIVTTRNFEFSRLEKKQINIIQEIIALEKITPITIFDYGLYPCLVASKIKQIPEVEITKMYKKMPIKELTDLNITFEEMKQITSLNQEKTKKMQKILIEKILLHQLKNKKDHIIKFLKEGNNEI